MAFYDLSKDERQKVIAKTEKDTHQCPHGIRYSRR